jgi:plasmid stabilization system protein ParE
VPRIIITEGATQGLERCRLFLTEKNPLAAARAARAIAQQFELLEKEPEMGRPWEELPKLRELLIPFGDSGYVALYRHEPDDNSLYVLAFRHQKEAGY